MGTLAEHPVMHAQAPDPQKLSEGVVLTRCVWCLLHGVSCSTEAELPPCLTCLPLIPCSPGHIPFQSQLEFQETLLGA